MPHGPSLGSLLHEDSTLADIVAERLAGSVVITDTRAGSGYEWDAVRRLWPARTGEQLADRVTRTLEAFVLEEARRVGLAPAAAAEQPEPSLFLVSSSNGGGSGNAPPQREGPLEHALRHVRS